MRRAFHDDILSNLLRTLYFNEGGYTDSQMSIIEKSDAQFRNIPCIHIRVSADNNDEIFAEKMLSRCRSWAEEQNIQLQGTAHIWES